jgi:hypothetical protein
VSRARPSGSCSATATRGSPRRSTRGPRRHRNRNATQPGPGTEGELDLGTAIGNCRRQLLDRKLAWNPRYVLQLLSEHEANSNPPGPPAAPQPRPGHIARTAASRCCEPEAVQTTGPNAPAASTTNLPRRRTVTAPRVAAEPTRKRGLVRRPTASYGRRFLAIAPGDQRVTDGSEPRTTQPLFARLICTCPRIKRCSRYERVVSEIIF